MKLTDFLDPERIIPELKETEKRAVLKEMTARLAALDASLDAEKLFETLLEREKISSTAIGEGVAIPHGKWNGSRKLTGLFARSLRGANFESLDGGPTHLFFVLLAAEDSAADHLKALARIARLLRDQDVAKKLRASRDAQAIYSVLALPPASAA